MTMLEFLHLRVEMVPTSPRNQFPEESAHTFQPSGNTLAIESSWTQPDS